MKKNKNKYPLVMMVSNKLFDIETFAQTERELFDRICKDYPVDDKYIYMIQVDSKKYKEEPEVTEEPKTDFPEDFQPLYKVGEVIKIAIENGKTVQTLNIQSIRLDGKKYYYRYFIEELGQVKEMAEQWLVDHEVLDK